MRPPLQFFVAGLPVASPRVRARARGAFAQVYMPGDADHWKMIVRNEARRAWEASENNIPRPFQGPVCVHLTFYFPRPKVHFRANGELKPNAPRWHTTKPDRDNADKAVLDALTNLGIRGDDKQVCDGRIRKLYSSRMGCEIEIKEIDSVAAEQPAFELTLERTI
jgi:Holliday junction resolvase RusA-like endonuclease